MVSAGRDQAQAAARPRAWPTPSAAGATQAEVLFSEGDSALTRFANSEIHQNVAERDTQVSLRFVDGRRVGCAATNRLDDEALRRLADRAADHRATAAGAGGRRSAARTAAHRAGRGRQQRGDREGSPESRAAAARAVIAAADAVGVLAFGSFTTSVERVGVVNSAGVDVVEERTSPRSSRSPWAATARPATPRRWPST